MNLRLRLILLRNHLQKYLCCQIPRRYLNTVKFPHPVGIIIGDGVTIGKDVRIYQNVTIGLIENVLAGEATNQYPTIGDGVIIYAGAVIAGPLNIGPGSVIGANAVITRDLPAGSVAFGRNQVMPTARFPADATATGSPR